MNRHALGFVLIVLLGLLGVWGFKALLNNQLFALSDHKVNTTIHIGGDGYLGYFFITSPEMKRQAARAGVGIDFTNDGGTYADRLEKFNKGGEHGGYDCIVLPVNSYLQHGLKYNYPGIIVASIAESRGADAIVGFANKLPNGKVTDLNNAALKIAYTSESPSSFLLDLTTVDFDLDNLNRSNTWRLPVDGSTQAYELLKQRKADVAVMWEPDVSRAMRDIPGLKEVWGSDKFSGYIDDVFVFRKDYVQQHEAEVVKFFQAYFSAMRSYKSDRARLIQDMKQSTGLQQAEIEAMVKKIDWHDLQANCSRQFGIKTGVGNDPSEGVVNTTIACTNVLVKTGKLQKDPLDDPYKIVFSGILKQVQTNLPADIGNANGKPRDFSQLSDDDWKSLKEIGVMRVEPITFQQGSATLDEAGQEQVDAIAKLLANNYPDTRVVVRGHTGPSDDESENVRLSRERAEAVVQRLVSQHNIPANRLLAEGKGSSQPPAHKPDENARAYMYRQPRVEFDLFADNGF